MTPKKKNSQSKSVIFPVVAIGASAGGLEAFTELLKNLPANTGMAFVFIQHLDPTHESMLSDIASRTTKMPTVEVKNKMPIKPDHVYIIPPNKSMTLSARKLCLVPRPEMPGLNLPINCFFSSLSKERGSQAIGIILSGTASDGVIGQKAIKSQGGITFSQDIESAKYDSMPRNAIATGCIDYIMRPQAIAKKLIELSKHLPLKEVKIIGIEELLRNVKGDLTRIFFLLKYYTGVDFTHYKKTTIERRINRRMGMAKVTTLKDYLKYLRSNMNEVEFLFQDLLINVTSFFRDPQVFKVLEKKVFPLLYKNRIPDQPIRIWVTACSTGEEAYSLLFCLLEFLRSKGRPIPIQIFATDVNEAMIDKARRGLYPESIKANIPPEILKRYFVLEDGGYRIVKFVREMCVFAKQDLTRDPPFSKLALVTCRNMLIYLEPELQKSILNLFHYSLNPSGFLVLGPAESVNGFPDLFSPFDKRIKIFVKKYVPTPTRMQFTPERYPSDLIKKHKELIFNPKKLFIPSEVGKEKEQAMGEELCSVLEELQSANEELQSSNEEMETSKEELQSTNEELTTLNDELSSRNAELVILSSDIQNLFNSTRMPVIMIGRDLCIRRFTPMAQKLWNLIATDVGRRITDINPNIQIPHLEEILFEAIDNLRISELEVQEKNGCWYSMTVYPYKNIENKIDGAVITLFDIHEIKLAKEKIGAIGEHFKNIVETISEPLIVLTKDLRVKTVNEAFYTTFEVFRESAHPAFKA